MLKSSVKFNCVCIVKEQENPHCKEPIFFSFTYLTLYCSRTCLHKQKRYNLCLCTYVQEESSGWGPWAEESGCDPPHPPAHTLPLVGGEAQPGAPGEAGPRGGWAAKEQHHQIGSDYWVMLCGPGLSLWITEDKVLSQQPNGNDPFAQYMTG